MNGDTMKAEYNFKSARKNPYAAKLKQSVTLRLDTGTLAYFKELAETVGLPYQTLINLYLRDCAATGRRLTMEWQPSIKMVAEARK